MRFGARLLIAGVAALLAACGGGAAAPGDDPVQTVQALYQPYLAEAATLPDLENVAPWTEDMEPLLARAADSEYGLGFDPVIDGQDFEIANLEVALEGPADDRATTVRADFTNLGEATTVYFDMVRADDGWRVRDVHTDQWALRGLLAALPAPAEAPPESN